MIKRTWSLSLSLVLLFSIAVFAQDQPASDPQAKPAAAADKPAAPSDEAQAEALQKATQNPVANLISVPIQNNSNFNIGPYNRTQDVLNIQPVIPFISPRTGTSSPVSFSRSSGSPIPIRPPEANTGWAI